MSNLYKLRIKGYRKHSEEGPQDDSLIRGPWTLVYDASVGRIVDLALIVPEEGLLGPEISNEAQIANGGLSAVISQPIAEARPQLNL